MTDPLNINIDLQGVDTSLPLLPEADYELQVAESTIVKNKAEDGFNWKLKLVTVSPHTAVDGREIAPNFPVFTVSALQAKPDSTDPEGFKRMLGDTIDAIFGTDINDRPAFNRDTVSASVGRKVIAHVVIDTYQGKQNNKISRLKKVE